MELENVNCPICEADHSRFWGKEFKNYVIVKCARCGLRYVNPRRKAEAVKRIYRDRYFEGKQHGDRDIEEGKHIIDGDYRSLKRALAYTRVEDPRILDIGTGTGSFLKLARLFGFRQLVGVDITDVNAEDLRRDGITLHVGKVADLDGGPFDVVTAHHVLEHVTDPNPFLGSVRAVMADSGIFHLLVPNEGSLNSNLKSLLSRYRLKKRAYKHLSPGHHMFFYDRDTLRRLLSKNGFETLYMGTRAGEKDRTAVNRCFHGVLDMMGLNTWLEVVAAKGSRA